MKREKNMRKIGNIAKRMIVVAVSASMLVTSLPASVLAAELEAAAGDAEAYLAGVSDPAADYAEAQEDISSSGDLSGNEDTSGDMDAVTDDPEESSDESLSGDDPADQEDAVISDDPMDDDTDTDETSEEETDDELFGLEEPEETEPLGDPAPSGVTGTGTEAEPLVVGTWTQLSEKMAEGGYISLGEDVSPDEGETFLSVPSEKEVTLDLNGHIIDRALTEAVENGYVIKVEGTLTLKDSTETEPGNGTGAVTGGWNTQTCGGVYVNTDGTLLLQSGKISGNKATHAGGVYSTGTIGMTGGAICDNSAEKRGGGVYIVSNGTMDMQGGTICGNNANLGGGVAVYGGSFNISGGSICDNTASPNPGGGSGGGVMVGPTSSSSFSMSGGKIIGNLSLSGGGIFYGLGTCSISGGEISGNTVQDYIYSNTTYIAEGGGIYASNETSVHVQGSLRIENNKHSGDDNNVFLESRNAYLDPCVIAITDSLTEDAHIGVYSDQTDFVITSGLKDRGTLSNFTSDRGGEILLNEAGEAFTCSGVARVVVRPEPTYNHKYLYRVNAFPVYNDDAYFICCTGAPIELVTPGKAIYGTMMYAVTGDDTRPAKDSFSEAIPTATMPGDYYVWYYANGDSTHADSDVIETDNTSSIYVRIEYDNNYQSFKRKYSHSKYVYPYYYAAIGRTVRISDILDFLGMKGEIEACEKLDDTDNRIVLGEDTDGQWTVTADRTGDTDINLTIDGKPYRFTYKAVEDNGMNRWTLDPCFPGSKLINMESPGPELLAPGISRPGYRFVAWVDHLYDTYEINYVNGNGNNHRSFRSAGDDMEPGYWYAVWEPVEGEMDNGFDDVIPEKGGEIRIGGRNWLQIGKGGGKILLVSAGVTGGITNLEDATDSCNSIYDDDFTVVEQSAAVKQNDGSSLFLLSTDEALKYMPSPLDRAAASPWWLRRQDKTRGNYVNTDGMLRMEGNYVHDIAASRPAFVLDESKVLLESDAADGKPEPGSGFRSFSTGGVQKLTLIDPEREFTAALDGSCLNAGSDLSISYQGSRPGGGSADREYVSAVLFDENGEAAYYASASVLDADGTWSPALPAGMPEGRYLLWIFGEQRNGEDESDYASRPAVFAVTVTAKTVSDVAITGGDRTISYGDELTLTAKESGKKAAGTWTSTDPSVVSVDKTTGKIRAMKPGKAMIIFYNETPDKIGRATAVITVEPKLLTLTVNGPTRVRYDKNYHYPDVTLEGVLEGDICELVRPKFRHKQGGHYYEVNYETNWVMYLPGTYHIHLSSDDLSNSRYAIADTTIEYVIERIPVHIEWSQTEFEYDGTAHKPTAALKNVYDVYPERSGLGYDEDTRFVVTGEQTEPGTYTATVNCNLYRMTDDPDWKNEEYGGEMYYVPPGDEEKTVQFTITKASLDRDDITLGDALTYNGEMQEQAVTVKIGDTDVTDECEIVGNKGKDAGTYRLTVRARSGSAHVTGSATADFTIAKKPISAELIPAGGSYTYTGSSIMPEFNILCDFGDHTACLDEQEYDAVMTGNVDAGEGTITVTPAEGSNYTFEPQSASFTIGKAVWNGEDTAELSRNYLFSETVSDGIDLSEYLPENCGAITSAVLDPLSGGITYADGRAPKIVGTNLTYTVSGNTGAASGTITAKLSTQNYSNEFRVTVNVRQQVMGLYEQIDRQTRPKRTSRETTVGKSFTLTAEFYAENVDNKKVVWHSSNPDIATVNQDGKVIAMAAGSTVITAVSEYDPDQVFTQCTVTVTEPVTSLTLDAKSYPFGTGEVYDLTAQLLPFTAVQDVIWSTSDKDVVIVCGSGDGTELGGGQGAGKGWTYGASPEHKVRIKAVGPGSAKITAEAADGSGKKAACSFSVGNAVPAGFRINAKGGEAELAAGKTLAMIADWGAKADTPKNTGLTWKVVKAEDGSDASSIASISEKGVLTGLSEGTVKVIATSTADKTKTAESSEITVYVPVKSASINMTSGTLSTKHGSRLTLSVNAVSAVAGLAPTGETLGEPVTVRYALDPSYSDLKSRDYGRTKNYKKYIRVNSETGVITVDGNAMDIDGIQSLDKINVIATVTGYKSYFSRTFTCRVNVAASNPLRGVKLSKTSLSLGEGSTFALAAALDPVNPDGDTGIIWESDHPEIASVDEHTGVITAHMASRTKAVITATTKQKVAGRKGEMNPLTVTCKVTVTPSVTSISFKKIKTAQGEVNRLERGKTCKIDTELTYSDGPGNAANKELIWTVEKEDGTDGSAIATVSQKGAVKGISPGKVIIRAKSSDQRPNGGQPEMSAVFEIFAPVSKLALDKTKLTLGTQRGSQYGRVSIVNVLPLDVTDASVEWKTSSGAVKIAAADNGSTPLLDHYIDATGKGLDGTKNETGDGVTVGAGQYLAVMAVTPGVVTLTGITKDGSNKKVTCTVTVRGETTGLKLKTAEAKGGVNDVTLADEASTENVVEYTGAMKAGGSLTLTPLIDINGISAATEDNEEKKLYSTYKKYTDMGAAFRSSDISAATVDRKGKISVSREAAPGKTVTIYAVSADGKHKAAIKITVTD